MISLKNLTAAPACLQRMLLPSAVVWPGHHVLARQKNASGRCSQPPPIQNKYWDQVGSLSWCHIDVCLTPQDIWPRLVQRHNGTLPSWWCTDLTLNGGSDRQGHASPEWQDFTGASVTNSPLMVTSWPWTNEWSSHHPAETILWQTSMEAMPVSTKQWTWPECAFTGPAWKQTWPDYIKQCLTCIECSNLPVEMLKPCEVPPRPWVKIGVDFFQDHLGKKAPNSSRPLQQVPIHVFPVASATSFKDHHPLEGTLCSWRCTCCCHVWQWTVPSNGEEFRQFARDFDNRPPFNGEEFRQFAREFDFVHTTSSPYFPSI